MNNGGPAFPVECYFTEHGATGVQTSPSSGMATGLTIRDYFAAKALAGICAHVDTWGLSTNEKISAAAYELADAMLAQRDGG